MNRKRFVELFTAFSGIIASDNYYRLPDSRLRFKNKTEPELSADVVICGGGLGGCAAAFGKTKTCWRSFRT